METSSKRGVDSLGGNKDLLLRRVNSKIVGPSRVAKGFGVRPGDGATGSARAVHLHQNHAYPFHLAGRIVRDWGYGI